jgi:hypothetical protein
MRTTSRFTRVAVSAGLVVAVGAGVLGMTSFASAQISGPSPAPQAVEVSTSEDTSTTIESKESGSVKGQTGHGGKMGHIKAASEEVAAVLNLTIEELVAELRDSKSLAAIAEAQNVDISKVKEVLTAEFKAHLDEYVVEGKLTQAQADEKLAKFTSRLDDMVNKARPQGGMKGEGHRRGGHGPRGIGDAQRQPNL